MADALQLLQTYFQARQDVYAVGYPAPDNPNKYRYAKVQEALTPEVLAGHVAGRHCVGVYPLLPDSSVHWFAIDFDGHTFAEAYRDAQAQADRLRAEGLFVYLERSRSGFGVHLWGFLTEPVPAVTVRRALRPLLLGDRTFDRMFPVQDRLTEQRPLGNLIALPFHGAAAAVGNSMFLGEDGVVVPPEEWKPRQNRPALLELLAGPEAPAGGAAPSASDTNLRPGQLLTGALKVLSPYGCQFMRQAYQQRATLSEPAWYAAIQQTTVFQHGRELAQLMSQGHPGYSPTEVDKKFQHASAHSPVGCAYIHEHFPEMACSGCPMTAPYRRAELTLQELVVEADQPMTAVGSFEAELEALERDLEPEGLPWPIPGMDDLRLRPGELTVVGAMPSRGKTWLMVDAAVGLARMGIPVLVFSAETASRNLRRRILANVAEVDSRKLSRELPLDSGDKATIRKAADELKTLPLYVDYVSMSPTQVLTRVEQTLLRYQIPLDKPYVVFFDYLQFGARLATDRTEYDQVSRLSTEFKLTGKLLEQPLVVFSQLRRETEDNDQPALTWFRSSGRIEQDLDVGVIITGERMAGERAPRTLTAVKQREGLANFALEYTLVQTYGRWIPNRSQTVPTTMPVWSGPDA